MKTIGVIGCGPAGLVTIKELKEKGFAVKAFDRCSLVSGQWALDPQNYSAGVWKTLCANDERRFLAFSDFPWQIKKTGQDKLGHFPHCTEIKAYLEAYAQHFNLVEHIQFETEVVRIELSEDETTWAIVSKKKNDKKSTAHTFDGIVVCSGMHAKPLHPLKDKQLKGYTGHLMHSNDFEDATAYKGKTVLVVGSSVLALEISSVLADKGECALVHNSMREIPYHLNKGTQNGSTVSAKLFIHLPAWLSCFLPPGMVFQGLKDTVLKNFPEQVTPDLAAGRLPNPDIRITSLQPIVSYMKNLKKGNIVIKHGVVNAKEKCVFFADGTSQDYDVVICGTGYEVDVSFLPKKVQKKIVYKNPFSGGKQLKLYKWTLSPDIETLAFAGVLENVGAQFPMAEMQARYIAAIWSGSIPRPLPAKLRQGAEALYKSRQGFKLYCYDIMPNVCKSLGDKLGVTPSIWMALSNPSKYLFGPHLAVYYRTNPKVDGPENARRFQTLWDEYMANPSKIVV